jgi:predicted Zn-dependent peptidase
LNSSTASDVAGSAYPITRCLSNGLRVHYYRRPGRVVALGLAISVGGWHDPPGKEGLAFLLTLALVGSARAKATGTLDAELNRRAARAETDTGPERTYFYLSLPAAEVGFGLRHLRRLVFEPSLTPMILQRERLRFERSTLAGGRWALWARWLNWWLISFSASYTYLGPAVRHALARGTGLERPIGGSARSRRAVTADDLREFYQRYYRPERAALVLVGPVAPDELDLPIERSFGDLGPSRAPAPGPAFASFKALRPPRWRHILREETPGWTWLGVGCLLPAAAGNLGPFFLARDALADELRQRLAGRTGNRFALWADLEFCRQQTLLILRIGVARRYQRFALDEAEALLGWLAAGPVEPSRLERLRTQAHYQLLVNLERTQDLLHWLSGQPGIFTDTPPAEPGDAVQAVTPEMVLQVAAGLGDPANHLVLVDQPLWLWVPVAVLVGVGLLASCVYLVLWLWQWLVYLFS